MGAALLLMLKGGKIVSGSSYFSMCRSHGEDLILLEAEGTGFPLLRYFPLSSIRGLLRQAYYYNTLLLLTCLEEPAGIHQSSTFATIAQRLHTMLCIGCLRNFGLPHYCCILGAVDVPP